MGVALESTRFAEAELAVGQLVPLREGRFRGIRRVMHHLVTRNSQRGTHRIRAFRSWLLKEVGGTR